MKVALVLLTLLLASGCTVLHVPCSLSSPCLPGTIASDRCVILVEAIPDLGRWGHLPEISCLIQANGIETVYFDPCKEGFSAEDLAAVIRHQRCRLGKHVMLVGWSYGTIQCLDALKLLADEGIDIDTLINIECLNLNLHRGFEVQPSNVQRTVLVYRKLSRLPRGFCDPVVVRLDTVRHLQALGTVETVETIYREACSMAADKCAL